MSPQTESPGFALQVANNKRYAAASGKGFTVAEVAQQVERDCGKIDIMVHSLANGPEVTKPLLETSRRVSKPACCIVAFVHICRFRSSTS